MKRNAWIYVKSFWLAIGLIVLVSFTAAPQILAADLTAEEKEWLLYMREEEKLARDVYMELYAKWRLNIFNNIASSEQNHMDAIKNILDRYGLEDPTQGNGRGEFTDSHIQELYNSLIAKGLLSKRDALEVGVIIEETDIIDLKLALDATNDLYVDIERVYANLLAGSYNHLDAFNSQLRKY